LKLLDKSRRNFKSLAANLHREDSEDYEKTQTVKRSRFPSWHPSLESLEAEQIPKKDSLGPVPPPTSGDPAPATPPPLFPLKRAPVSDDAVSLPEHEVFGNLLRVPQKNGDPQNSEEKNESPGPWGGGCRANSMTLPPPANSIQEMAPAGLPFDGIPAVVVAPP